MAIIWITPALAQISAGGTPPSFKYEPGHQTAKSAINVPIDFDVVALRAEDVKREAAGLPPRVGQIIPVNLTTENSGEWTTLPDGQHIWRLTLVANDAIAIMLTYDKFEIPAGGQLFIYNEDRSRVLGAYTEMNNPKRVEYATEFVSGDQITLEYLAPSGGNFTSPVIISGVVYGYNHLFVDKPKADGSSKISFDPSGGCMVNVNCPEGDDWVDEKQGVVRILTRIGSSYALCSGALLNNTLRNLDPLFLSAYHCYEDFSSSNINQSVYYFKYEHPTCSGRSDPNVPTLTGATMLVEVPINGGSDGALLRLNEGTPQWFIDRGIYFNGWDRRNTPATSGVSIHHPRADVKKISTFTTAAQSTGNVNFGGGAITAAGSGWNVIFRETESGHGVTEPGSSGSPLFDQNHRIVGTLSGGLSSCGTLTGSNIYGKLWYHYDRPSNTAQHMKPYLDPVGSGEEYIDGTYIPGNPVALFVADRTEIFASESVNFTDYSDYVVSWEWEFPGGTPGLWTTQTPPPILYSTQGTYDVKLTINKGTPGQQELNYQDYIKVTLKDFVEQDIGTGTATGQIPLGSTGNAIGKVYTATLYPASSLTWINGDITAVAWSANTAAGTATSELRTVKIYLKHEPGSSTTLNYADYAAAQAGAVQVAEYANWKNTTGYQTFSFNMNGGAFAYSAGSALVVIVETEFTTNATRNPETPYTTTTNTVCQWTAAYNAAIAPTAGPTNIGNRPNIRIRNRIGVTNPVADFSINNSTAATVTIFEGETVAFTDLSTGPPVMWEWTLPGANQANSTAETVTTAYMNAGTYAASLKVSNTLGNNTKTKTVIVNAQTPVADFFAHSNAFLLASTLTTAPTTATSNNGLFLPLAGGSVSFEDKSANYPRTWQWTLPGATPSTSAEQNPTVSYPAGTATYNVTLVAANSAGSSTAAKSNFIKVGGTAVVWNVPPGEVPNVTYDYGSPLQPVPGVNVNITQSAERFVAPAGGELSQVRVWLQDVTQNAASSLTLTIYSDNNGLPGVPISPTLYIQGGNIINNDYNNLSFPTPVPVADAFHVVMGSTAPNQTYYAVPAVNRELGRNTVSMMYQDTWYTAAYFDYNLSMNIQPEFTYTTGELTSVSPVKRKDVDATPSTITFITSGHAWRATVSDSWIILSANTGTVNLSGAGSLTFTCLDNTDPAMRSGTITVYAGGVPLEVTVVQGGSFPENITAEYDYNEDNILLTWGTSSSPVAGTTYRIFRDTEMIAENLTVKQYRDLTTAIGTSYCYQITATYLGDPFFESVKSMAECVFHKSLILVTANNQNMQENGALPVWTRTITGQLLSPETSYNQVVGSSTYTTTGNVTSPAGTYTIGIETENLLPNKYAIKDVTGMLFISSVPTIIIQQPVGGTVCEGRTHTLTVVASGIDLTYQWQKRVQNNWQTVGYTQNYTMSGVRPEDMGVYRVMVIGRSNQAISQEVELRVALSPSNILVFEWNDVPTVNCNPATNGGHEFISFQWYRNGVIVAGATKPYILAEPGAAYDCEILTSDGKKFHLCDYTASSSGIVLSVYPNPALAGGNVTVRLNNTIQGAVINIFDLNGNLVKGNIPMSGSDTTITINGITPGMYIIQLVSPDGVKRTTNVVIK